ncbi:hypothetical protein [Oceanobacillus timonensis]|uniref:hypothetical protein n=1 Tax=Oceanobacillus timonensis TaxID=1926285 RepID=UPI0009BB9E9A|nr:hypothetical protein [Oceanobacillus timonensis]
MVYLNQQKRIYAEDIKGSSSNQEMFVYAYARERDEKQLEMQKESAEVLQQLQRDMFAKNQQLERIAKRLTEMDKNKQHLQQGQEKVLQHLDVLDGNIRNETRQLTEMRTEQENAKSETDDMQHNQLVMQEKLEKMDTAQTAMLNKMEKQEQILEEMQHQSNQKDKNMVLLQERMEKQEAWLDKLMRQMQDLRGIIYERADEIIKKVENSIQLFGNKWNVVQRNDTKSPKETLKK